MSKNGKKFFPIFGPVASNHIHLLVVDDNDRMTIPKAIQLTAGRVAQEYNQRKRLKGAYW